MMSNERAPAPPPDRGPPGVTGRDKEAATQAAPGHDPPGYDPPGGAGRVHPRADQAHHHSSAHPHDPLAAGATYAALDLGTNNCRLLIARPQRHGFRVVDAFSRIVRLGEGLSTTGALGEAAMERAIDALAVCADKLAARNVRRARMIATEACRVASNGREFVNAVAERTGIALEIIDQRTEAMLAVTGCASLVDRDAESVIIFDIGGGSTELAWLHGRSGPGDPAARIRAWISLPIGVVSVAERHGGVHVDEALFERMVAEAAEALAPFAAKASPAARARGFHLLGTSGTVTTVAGLHLGLERYDRRAVDGLWMSDAEVSAAMRNLAAMPFEARAANGCIGRERADLVLAGCAIYEAIRRAFPCPRIRVADRGLREGMLIRMMHQDRAWRRPQGAPGAG
jgi:exopolyphosphatase/guanosine-5'-triphosphate,3'-diphosphate pyrophosphatase